MYAGGILPRLLAFSPREKAACCRAAGMPMPEGRMRGIREKLAPLSRDAGGPFVPAYGQVGRYSGGRFCVFCIFCGIFPSVVYLLSEEWVCLSE